MIQRLTMRRGMWRARKAAVAWAERLRAAGELTLRFDETGASASAAGFERRWRFADAREIEDAGGMIYLWPRDGEPLFWPTRVYGESGDGAALIAFARAHGASVRRVAAAVDDDD